MTVRRRRSVAVGDRRDPLRGSHVEGFEEVAPPPPIEIGLLWNFNAVRR